MDVTSRYERPRPYTGREPIANLFSSIFKYLAVLKLENKSESSSYMYVPVSRFTSLRVNNLLMINTIGEVAAHSVHRSSDGLVLCLIRGVHADRQ